MPATSKWMQTLQSNDSRTGTILWMTKSASTSLEGDSPSTFVAHGENGPEDIMRTDAKKDLGIRLSTDVSLSVYREKSPQKAFAVLRMIRHTFSRIIRMNFQILYGTYVRPLLEYANQVVHSGRKRDVTLIGRVQRATMKMGERQPLNNKNNTDPGNLGEDLDQSVGTVKITTYGRDRLEAADQCTTFLMLPIRGLSVDCGLNERPEMTPLVDL
ncbi:hypothetical protein CLF_109645 [Clonorchis sinensis]|uniref:Uncharacterized protein n=1 Tax=Clonorchis sinensis TaxID=79923 RepID=G7YJM2_CLOSI|nr:hypothetical protein CLF_109645 [Clonorchis sinensis]